MKPLTGIVTATLEVTLADGTKHRIEVDTSDPRRSFLLADAADPDRPGGPSRILLSVQCAEYTWIIREPGFGS